MTVQRLADRRIRTRTDHRATTTAGSIRLSSPLGMHPAPVRDGACACGGGCPRCARRLPPAPELRVSAPGDALELEAERLADRAMRRRDGTADAGRAGGELEPGGAPLASDLRSSFEARFGHDFSSVRVHADRRAAAAARAVNARAYTIGDDIVFAAGEYAPATFEGQRLIAHELVHVQQQQRGSPAQVQRAADFGSMYRGPDGKVRSHGQKEYSDYRKGLGETKASSEAGGHAFHAFSPITREELLTVYRGVAKDIDSKQGDDKASLEAIVDFYVAKLNQAFETFKIDTVEAQGSYIANAWRESDQFRFMTETQKAVKTNAPYESNPKNVKLNTTWLDAAATGHVVNRDGSVTDVVNYEPGGSINPARNWQQSFIGRGPIQATHRHFYVQALAVMENRADELAHSRPHSQDEADLREAIDAIKTDPREAANPKYAFMFSAAFMKMPDDKGVRGDVKATQGRVTDWMGIQPSDAKKDKDKAYAEALKMLMPKWDEDQANYQRAHTHTPAEMAADGEPGDWDVDD